MLLLQCFEWSRVESSTRTVSPLRDAAILIDTSFFSLFGRVEFFGRLDILLLSFSGPLGFVLVF